MKKWVVFLLVTTIGILAFSLGSFSGILDSSASLTSFKAVVEINNYVGPRVMTILFNFEFMPPSKMKIVYLYPSNMKGMTIILNGENLYTYIPALKIKNHVKVGKKAKNPGESMGFFFYFVQRNLPKFLKGYTIVDSNEVKTLELKFKDENVSYKVSEATIEKGNLKEVILYDVKEFVPVETKIYKDEKLLSVVKVIKYEYNAKISGKDFILR